MINERLHAVRKELGMSQKEFGKALNLSQSHIASIETGHRAVTNRIINDACDKLDVNINWLMSGELPILNSHAEKLKIDNDVKELTKLYLKLSEEEQKLIKDLISSLLKE